MLNKLQDQRGFTLAELIIGTVITAIIALGLIRVGGDAAAGLDRSVDRATRQNLASAYGLSLRNDILISNAVTVYTAAAPVAGAATSGSLCGSSNSSTFTPDATAWTTPGPNFVRTLFSLRQDFIDPNAVTTSSTYQQPQIRWVGYEVRGRLTKDASGASYTSYSIWRVTCTESLGTVDVPALAANGHMVYDFGRNYDTSLGGDQVLFCGSSAGTPCATSGQTGIDNNDTIQSFTSVVPFKNLTGTAAGVSGSGSLTKSDADFTNSITINLQRKVG